MCKPIVLKSSKLTNYVMIFTVYNYSVKNIYNVVLFDYSADALELQLLKKVMLQIVSLMRGSFHTRNVEIGVEY